MVKVQIVLTFKPTSNLKRVEYCFIAGTAEFSFAGELKVKRYGLKSVPEEFRSHFYRTVRSATQLLFITC